MAAFTHPTPSLIAYTPETGQINLCLRIIRSQQLALSAVSDLLCDRDHFPDTLEPEALAILIDAMTHAISKQLDIIAESSEAIDAKARRADKEGGRHV